MKRICILITFLLPFTLFSQYISYEDFTHVESWYIDGQELKYVTSVAGYTNENNISTRMIAVVSFIMIQKEWKSIIDFYEYPNGKKIDIAQELLPEPNNVIHFLSDTGIKIAKLPLTPFEKGVLAHDDRYDFSNVFDKLKKGEILDIMILDKNKGGYFLCFPENSDFNKKFKEFKALP